MPLQNLHIKLGFSTFFSNEGRMRRKWDFSCFVTIWEKIHFKNVYGNDIICYNFFDFKCNVFYHDEMCFWHFKNIKY